MPSIIETLADRFSGFGVKAVYGDPVEVDGTTIIPVAYTHYGFGVGTSDETDDRSEGGGGGGASVPIGAYVSRGGDLRFEPNIITVLVVGIPFVCVAGRALARVIRAAKK
ncbi:hypothetical protein MN032_10745 [Agromyces atrinae]|uniref:Putative spore protein YtfJ n=1 Tax=Agromyces atrinae TaxID=592376 RepID=A0A4V1R2H7_9MICO|nr:spore germination protein GerW family protein [Agromyces atrinae]MCI2958174.1 hypothetical protein [Agromyces atrinae]NYD66523.1 putative spore protein YtfJ [Agromyces atrinae]RXZ87196.1 hypothetical protein ESP50_04550 [Agromyces atrinae]